MWKYRTLICTPDTHGKTFSGHILALNDLGEEDWELVAVLPVDQTGRLNSTTNIVYFFKKWYVDDD